MQKRKIVLRPGKLSGKRANWLVRTAIKNAGVTLKSLEPTGLRRMEMSRWLHGKAPTPGMTLVVARVLRALGRDVEVRD